jgi:tetratricopeptide (TPR) repeat protein
MTPPATTPAKLSQLPRNLTPGACAPPAVTPDLGRHPVEPARRSVAFDLILADPPNWLGDAPSVAWETVAVLAQAHGRRDVAVKAFVEAADADLSDRARLLARAAVAAAAAEDPTKAIALVGKAAGAAATDGETAFVEAVRAAISHDADDLSTSARRAGDVLRAVDVALSVGALERVMLLLWRAQALLNLDRVDDAIDTLDLAVDADEAHAGTHILLARALAIRASDDRSSTRVSDSQRALHHALVGRDLRRVWGGDSREAAELACGGAFMLGDWPAVERLGTVRVDGARSGEVDNPAVQQLVRLARLQMGDEAGAGVLEPKSDFDKAWTKGLMLARNAETRSDAIGAFLDAVALAANEIELDRAQRGVAQLGHLPIPRIDEVERRDGDHAGALIGLAHLNAGNHAAAVQQLRPLTARSRLAALTLAEAYDALGGHNDAMTLLEAAGRRFRDAHLFTRLALVRLRIGDMDGASRAVEEGLAVAAPVPSAREELHSIRIDAAVGARDPFRVAETTAAALADGIDNQRVFWTHIQALAELRRFREAWKLLRSMPLTELVEEPQAIVYLHVHARSAPAEVAVAADVLDRFSGSHDVLAVGLGLFLSIDFEGDVHAESVRRMQDHLRRFTERFPDSPILRSSDVTPDDPEVLREQLRAMLRPDPDHDQGVRELSEATAAGRLPVGFVAGLLGRSYLSIVLGGSTIGFTCIPQGDVFALDVMTATTALDGPAVVDLSSLCVASALPDHWVQFAAAFTQLTAHHDHFAEIDELIFQRSSAGTLHWDHRADTWTMTEVSDADTEAFRSRRQWLRERADDLELHHRALELEDLGEAGNTGSWARAIALAKELGAPLWCDDVATAAVARSLGVPTFSTFGLLSALCREGRLTHDQCIAALNAMYLAQADDLPMSADALVDLARRNGFPIGPSVHPVSRPLFWQDRGTAFQAFVDLVEALQSGGIDAVATLLQSAALGVTRSQVSGRPMHTIILLFVGAVFACRVQPEDVPVLIGVLRAVRRHYDLEDPLVPCAKAAYDTVAQEHGPAKAAQFVGSLFSEMGEADRHAVTEAILRP